MHLHKGGRDGRGVATCLIRGSLKSTEEKDKERQDMAIHLWCQHHADRMTVEDAGNGALSSAGLVDKALPVSILPTTTSNGEQMRWILDWLPGSYLMSISLLQALVDSTYAFCLTETLIYILQAWTLGRMWAGDHLAISNGEPASQKVRTLRANLHSSAPFTGGPEHPVAHREQRLYSSHEATNSGTGPSPPRASAREESTGGNWEGERYLVHCSFPLSCLALLVID